MIDLFNKISIKLIVCLIFTVSVSMTLWMDSSSAAEIDSAVRTVPLNAAGEQIMLTTKQLAIGQRKFNGSCAQCHLDGGTKPNPDVDLGPQTLTLANPPRNTIEDLVDYLNNPMTYDGAASLIELHPSTQNTDLFPKMRDLTEEDLTAIAGYILVQPKIIGEQWAGGKPKR